MTEKSKYLLLACYFRFMSCCWLLLDHGVNKIQICTRPSIIRIALRLVNFTSRNAPFPQNDGKLQVFYRFVTPIWRLTAFTWIKMNLSFFREIAHIDKIHIGLSSGCTGSWACWRNPLSNNLCPSYSKSYEKQSKMAKRRSICSKRRKHLYLIDDSQMD